MAAISNDWLPVLKEEFGKPYYRQLFQTVNQEYRTHQVFPPAEDIFNAFHLTPFHQVKVVILGQDPYHNYGQAHGLCFSVRKEWRSRRPWSISIRSFMTIWAVRSQTMGASQSGQSRACLC